jgi:hypothetical protein
MSLSGLPISRIRHSSRSRWVEYAASCARARNTCAATASRACRMMSAVITASDTSGSSPVASGTFGSASGK